MAGIVLEYSTCVLFKRFVNHGMLPTIAKNPALLTCASKNWPFGAFEFAGCLKNGLRQNRLLSFKAVLSDHDIRVFRRRCLFSVPFLFIFRFLVVVS